MIIAYYCYKYLRMEGVDALGLVLDPGLDVVQLTVSYLCFLVNLFCKSLKLFQALDFLVDHLVFLLETRPVL